MATQRSEATRNELKIDVSPSLVTALMPLLARLRQLFDLDADPVTIDAHLTQGGLGAQVTRTPGVRIPGAIDGFDIALRVLLRGRVLSAPAGGDHAARVAHALGEPIDTGIRELTRLAPSAARIAEAGSNRLRALGVPARRADAIVAVARLVANGGMKLEPGSNAIATRAALVEIDGIGDQLATVILMRTLSWPDAFPFACGAMAHAVSARSVAEFHAMTQRWRPWRAYAAMLLWHSRGRRGSTAEV
jgi:AraC family transcriptional regulator of adaptative response / DNA-3-methyladenine glycosylase II